MEKTWKIFVDGAARGNPGPSGAGIYISYKNEDVSKKGIYLKKKTNNQAEYLALLLGLFFLRKEIKKQDIDLSTTKNKPVVHLISDSELLVKQMKGEYKVKNPVLKQLKTLAEELAEGLSCKFSHVLRKGNIVADELANIGIDQKGKMPVSFENLLEKHNINI